MEIPSAEDVHLKPAIRQSVLAATERMAREEEDDESHGSGSSILDGDYDDGGADAGEDDDDDDTLYAAKKPRRRTVSSRDGISDSLVLGGPQRPGRVGVASFSAFNALITAADSADSKRKDVPDSNAPGSVQPEFPSALSRPPVKRQRMSTMPTGLEETFSSTSRLLTRSAAPTQSLLSPRLAKSPVIGTGINLALPGRLSLAQSPFERNSPASSADRSILSFPSTSPTPNQFIAPLLPTSSIPATGVPLVQLTPSQPQSSVLSSLISSPQSAPNTGASYPEFKPSLSMQAAQL